jgi:peptidoglycan/LPS O-acetylase OafA/YrhL
MNGGTWSASVESFFYLLFPYLMLFRKFYVGLLCFAVLLLLIVNLNILFGIPNVGTLDVYSNPVMRIPDFIIGIVFLFLASEGRLNNLPKVLKSGTFSFFVIFVLTSVISQSKASYQFMGMQFFIAIFFGLFIFASHNSKSFIMQNSIINFLGKISYSFYIWQFVAMDFGRFLKKDFGISSFSLVLIVFIINLIISVASYYIIEEPSRKFLISKLIKD